MHGLDVCDEKSSIMPLIADSMRAYKDMPSINCAGKQYTYGEVERLSGKIAAFLRDKRLKKGEVVSVLVPRCEYMSIAPLGILRAGGAYQPLDPSYPVERLKFMIEDADAPVIIASKQYDLLVASATDEGKKREVLYIEDIPGLPDSDEEIWENACGDDCFVILYTSGTTGVPKGIILTHGNIYSACKWHLDYYEVDENCRMGQHPSFVFDLAIVELLLPLTKGASIYIIPDEIRTDLNKLNNFLEKNKITHLTMTTQLGRAFAMSVTNNSLRHLTVGGEALVSVCPPKGYKLHNDYGPAECTLYTTIFPVEKEYTGKVPIGRAVDEVKLYVVDENGKEVGDGELGELCIAGPHVALGYLNRPELTEKSFTDNPFTDDPAYKRMYHSGDLVIRGSDGLFEFMGRADRQVKIRGIRIEPAEIEELLRTYDGIREVVIGTPEIGGQRVIVAYYISDTELDIKKMEDFVLGKKPSYMCPSFFIRISSIPLNTNGKVDFGKLPLPDFEQNKGAYVAPENDTEKALAGIYEELLETKPIGRNDDFMRIGGNSLLVMQLLYQIEKKFSCSLGTRDIMANPVVAELAALIDKRLSEGAGKDAVTFADKVLPERDFYPASSAQKRIYTAQQLLKEDDPTYLLSMSIKCEGVLDRSRVEAALEKLFARHESLRTRFFMQGSEIVQKIEPADEDLIKEAVKRAYSKEKPARLRLDEAPLFWWNLVDKELTFYWHHIINDGTGMLLFGREFAAIYSGDEPTKLTVHQKEYAAWEQEWRASDAYKNCIEDWSSLLEECAEAKGLRLPYDDRRKADFRAKAGHVLLTLEGAESAELEEACREKGVTPYTFFATVFSILLHKYSGMKKFLIGTAVDGRQQSSTSHLQGMFANTLPIPVSVTGSISFSEVLTIVRDRILFMLDNRQASLEDIGEAYEKLGGIRRTAHGHQLFDVFFVMRDFDSKLPDMDGFASRLYWPYDEMPMYDLTLEVGKENGSYYLVFEYDRSLFAKESIEWMGRHFTTLLQSCLQKHAGLISTLSMIDEEEKSFILDYKSSSLESFKADTVIDRLRQQAEAHPDKTAIVFENSSMTYKELWEASGKIAEKIMKSSCLDETERWVGLIAGRGFSMIAAIFGILRSGAGYVPISPEYPKERISFMLENSGAELVIACDVDTCFNEKIKEGTGNIQVIEISVKEHFGGASDEFSEEHELPKVEPSCNAYMIFTSGSTGEPKGVVVEHAQLSALLDAYKDIYELGSNDTVLQFANFVFDQSVWDIFHILTVGGCLCVIPAKLVRDPEKLAEYCEDKGVTAASLTPGFLRLMDPKKLSKLRLLDVGGEAPDKSLLSAWSEGRTVFNTYGPTETTVNATSYKFADKGRILFETREGKEKVPIGRAVPGTRTYILNGNEICAVGVPGELCIAGRQVSRGYKNREELTAEKFVKNPFGDGRMYRSGDLARLLPDGNIEFLGRTDDQVKIRGYRIELGEVEAALRTLPMVKDAAVIIREDEEGEKQLCGYYIPKSGDCTGNENTKIRAELEKSLPIYMIPSVLVPVSEFKLTINGKIDRRSLPRPTVLHVESEESESYVLPKSQEERDVVEAFEEVLNISGMKATDDFLSWGGDSIKAIMVVSLLRKKGYSVDAATLLRSRTARALSAYLKTEQNVIYREFEAVTPTPVMRMFTQAKMVNPSHYAQSAVFALGKDADVPALNLALEGLVMYHGMLRMIASSDGNLRIRDKEEIKKTELPVYTDLDEPGRIKIMNELSASLDPENGIVMRNALFRNSDCDRLFITFHHYIIDEVSWAIITDDLNSLYEAASEKTASGKAASEKAASYAGTEEIDTILPPRTVSFGEWSEALVKYGESAAFLTERDYWNKVHAEIEDSSENYANLLKHFRKDEPAGRKGSEILIKDIGKDISKKLIKLSKGRYKTRADVILAAIFARTVNSLYGLDKVLLQMESHGRGNIGQDLKCDRTVGWFTAVYPVLIPVNEDIDEQIVETKETFAGVPNYGLGYGLLYEDLVDIGGFVFNYLGDIRDRRKGLIEYTSEYAGEESDKRNVDPGTISVNIRAYDEGLRIECVYDCVYSGDRIMKLLDEYEKMCGASLEGVSGDESIVSPSDLCASDIMSMRDFRKLTKVADARNIEAIGPLTPLQKGMLYRLIAEPDTGAYMLQDRLLLKGEWKKAAFCDALKLAAVRFDVLRTRFALNGFEKPWQIILCEGVITPEYREISGQSIEKIAEADLQRGFAPEEDVLLRVTFNKDSEGHDEKQILVSSHHCILDGWSFRILTDTLMEYYFRLCDGVAYEKLYEEARKGATEGLKFSEYLRLTENRDNETALEKWDGYLSGVNEGAGIGETARSGNSENDGKAAYAKLSITGEKEKKIRQYAESLGVTLSSFFGTLLGILLGFENDISDIVFGETVSGRNINAESIEDAAGMFINTIPVRIKWEADTKVSELMKKRHEDYLEMQPFENASLDKIMSRKKAGSGLIKALYVYENYPAEEADSRYSVSLQHEEVDYPFSLSIEEKDGFDVEIQYDGQTYERGFIDRLLGRFDNLIMQIVTCEDIRISENERIPESEIKYMLSDIAGTPKEFPEETFIDMLYETVKNSPDKCAVIMDDRTLSYGQLWRAASVLARIIGYGDERYVAVYADRGLGMTVALIAAFLAGAAYVPLDPDYPDERLSFILADCEPVAVLRCINSGTKDRTDIFEDAGLRIIDICVDELLGYKEAELREASSVNIAQNSLAYMIYTSGTTGMPKGVEIEHGALSEMVHSNREFFGNTVDVILQAANYVFDASVFEFFVPLAYGGTVCMISKDKLSSSEAIARYCEENKVTCLDSTNAFLQALDSDKFGKFEVVCTGGDAANSDVFDKWDKHAGVMVNDYGPTEGCVNAISHKYVPGHAGPIPIGRPYANKKVYIMQQGKLCGIGQKGEICIGGKGLARGYHNRDELSAKAFVHSDYSNERIYRTGDIGYFDMKGNVYCLGRYDDQVKIRGYRIETGEIESRIREYDSIKEAAVISRKDSRKEAYLAAYITCKDDVDTDMLRAYLKKKLPAYMVPAAIVKLDSLPRNASDKLDTDALPVPEFSEHKEAPVGYLEEMIAALYEKVLGIDKVGRDDSFFELGGSSLDMMRLISELSEYSVSISDVASSPTPRLFGELLLGRYRGHEKKTDGVICLKSGMENKPSLFCIPPSGGMSLCYLPLIKELDYDGQVYGLTDNKYSVLAGMTLEELSVYEPRTAAWDETIECYFKAVEGLFKDGDILIGYSQGGPAAFMLAGKLENKGYRVGRLIMLEAPEPGETFAEESMEERMATAAAIFAGRTYAETAGSFNEKGTDESLSETEFFRKYLKDNLGENADKELLHSIFETYLVYSANVLSSVVLNNRIKTGIDSISLLENDSYEENAASLRQDNPWSLYSQEEGEAFAIKGSAMEHLAFLSKYKNIISEIVLKSIKKSI